MPTNQEWLHKLANESPDELKAWFDAEHNDNLADEKVVSGDAAHSNDGNAHLKAHSKTEPKLSQLFGILSDANDDCTPESVVTAEAVDANDANTTRDSREKLKADENEHVQKLDELDSRTQLVADIQAWLESNVGFSVWLTDLMEQVHGWLDRQAEITERQYEERVTNVERQIGAIKAANDDYREEVDRLQRRNDELRTSYDKLKRERDNLADDLLTCNREREHLRKNLGIALDHAHDICALVDIGE